MYISPYFEVSSQPCSGVVNGRCLHIALGVTLASDWISAQSRFTYGRRYRYAKGINFQIGGEPLALGVGGVWKWIRRIKV